MGFLWEGSTGARAVQILRDLPQGTTIPTPEFARLLGATGAALHQLLDNAVRLRLIKKIRNRGHCILWALGPGNDSATIERHRSPKPAPTAEELVRLALIAQRRAARVAELAAALPVLPAAPDWPPGFVSSFDPDAVRRRRLEALDAEREVRADMSAIRDLPLWLSTTPSTPAVARRFRKLEADEARCPSRYLARWRVQYAGEHLRFHGVIRLQAVDVVHGTAKAWCEAQAVMRDLDWDGLQKAADADSGEPVDLARWLATSARARPPRRQTEPAPHALRSSEVADAATAGA